MTAIFLFDLLACFMYPYLAIRLGYTPTQFGFLAGTAVNDTSSVVAAQETYAGLMGLDGYALPATIKVVRTAMIIVLALIFSVISIRNEARSAARSDGQHANIGKIMWKALPKFILAFVSHDRSQHDFAAATLQIPISISRCLNRCLPTVINSLSLSHSPALASRSSSRNCH